MKLTRVLNTAEAAKHLGISTRTLRRWVVRGILRPGRTPTGRYRFTRDELDRLMAEREGKVS